MAITKDFKGKGDIIVNVGQAEDDASGPGPRKRRGGPIPPQPRTKKTARRRIKAGNIIFYDLGQQKAGSTWTFNHWYLSPAIIGPPTLPPTIGDFEPADHEAIRAVIVPGDITTIAANYRRITKPHGDTFQIGLILDETGPIILNSANPKWTTSGLELTADELVSSGVEIYDPNDVKYFEPVSLNYGSPELGNKVTAVNDPDAARVVPFRMERGDVWFLMPRATRSGASTYDGTRNHLSGFTYQFRPRFPDIFPAQDQATAPGDDFAAMLAAFAILADQPGVRSFPEPDPGDDWIAGPIAAAEPIDATGSVEYSGGGIPAGLLLAIVKKGSNYFYIWNV